MDASWHVNGGSFLKMFLRLSATTPVNLLVSVRVYWQPPERFLQGVRGYWQPSKLFNKEYGKILEITNIY
jgi:hypothetical protein